MLHYSRNVRCKSPSLKNILLKCRKNVNKVSSKETYNQQIVLLLKLFEVKELQFRLLFSLEGVFAGIFLGYIIGVECKIAARKLHFN